MRNLKIKDIRLGKMRLIKGTGTAIPFWPCGIVQ